MRYIADSNKEIARSIFNSSKLILQGLNRIADELERKRKTEEYYLLLEKIELFEEQIIAKGGDLKKIYDEMEFEYKQPIILNDIQIQILINSFAYENSLEWLKTMTKFYQINPFDIFCSILAGSKLRVNPKSGHIDAVNDDYSFLCKNIAGYRANLYLDLYFDEFWYRKQRKIYFDEELKCQVLEIDFDEQKSKVFPLFTYGGEPLDMEDYEEWADCRSREGSFDVGAIFECDIDTKIALVKEMIHYFKVKRYDLDIEMINFISRFKDFISEVNSDIILNNLRGIHSGLLTAYKDLKMNNKN